MERVPAGGEAADCMTGRGGGAGTRADTDPDADVLGATGETGATREIGPVIDIGLTLPLPGVAPTYELIARGATAPVAVDPARAPAPPPTAPL
jgi:hypothetical protein